MLNGHFRTINSDRLSFDSFMSDGSSITAEKGKGDSWHLFLFSPDGDRSELYQISGTRSQVMIHCDKLADVLED